MTTDYVNAVDEMFGLFSTSWAALSHEIVGYMPPVLWQGLEQQMPPASKFWVRVSQQTVNEEQTTLQGSEEKRYTCDGLLFVQVFCPKAESDAMGKGRLLAQYAKNIFRGKTTASKIIFRNVRVKELADEDNYKRLNVIAEYEYDEIG